MRVLDAPLSRLAAVAVLCAAAALAAPDTYYPNAPGTQWRYSSGEMQQAGTPRTVRGVTVVPLSHRVGGRVVSEDLLEYQAGGVYLRGVQVGGKLTWYTPPLQVYPASPLSPGQVWTSVAQTGTAQAGLRLSGRVVGTQAVKTQSGSYNALVIRNEIASGPAASVQNATVQKVSTQYLYFVPGLGVVRYQAADGSTVDLLR